MTINSKFLMSAKGLDLLSKLFQSSGEGIMFFNRKGEIESMNPSAEEMFGYREQELIGKKVEVLIPEAVRKAHVSHRDQYVEHPTKRKMGEGRDLTGLRRDGSVFPLEASLSYIEHENETIIVGFITDISVRKENEIQLEEHRQQLAEYTSNLEKKVQERTQQLEHMNLGLRSQVQERKLAEEALKKSLEDVKKAEQEILKSLEKERELNELKSRFVSMASHEFRTPLTTILSSANLISRYEQSEQQDSRMKHIERIRNSVKNLTNILNDFLSVEKLESGKTKIEPTEVATIELLCQIKEEMELSKKKDQTITIEGSSEPVVTDSNILKNILLNLVSNAIKYSKDDGEIIIKLEAHADRVSFSVVDQGIGIPEAEQKNLFSRFFRAANATNIAGTGLGLTIVKRYADLLKGTVSFSSKENEGSTFTLGLPLKLDS